MGHDVVQLPGDPHAFLGDPEPRLLLPGALGVFGAGPGGREVGPPQPGHGAGGQREQQPEDGPDGPEEQRHVVHGVGEGRGERQHPHGREAVAADGGALGEGGQPVQRRHDGTQQQGREEVSLHDHDRGADPVDRDGGARVGAVPEQSEAGHAHEDHGQSVIVRRYGPGQREGGAERRGTHQRQDQCQVDEEGMTVRELLQAVRVAPLHARGHRVLRWVGSGLHGERAGPPVPYDTGGPCWGEVGADAHGLRRAPPPGRW